MGRWGRVRYDGINFTPSAKVAKMDLTQFTPEELRELGYTRQAEQLEAGRRWAQYIIFGRVCSADTPGAKLSSYKKNWDGERLYVKAVKCDGE